MVDVPRDPPITAPPIRLAVCVSGEGTTLQNLIDQIKKRRLKAEVVQVVASRPRIGAIARAEAAKIPLALANYNSRSKTEFSASVFEPIRHAKADLVILAGFLSLLKIPPDYRSRVINVHPSLIPGASGCARYRCESQRLHGPLCRQHLRYRPDYHSAPGARAGKRYRRQAGRPRI